MGRRQGPFLLGGLAALAAALAVACGPAAAPTATTGSQPTATTAPAATATTAAVTTATAGGETKLRPYPVLEIPPVNAAAKKGGTVVYGDYNVPPDYAVWESAVAYTIQDMAPAYDTLLEVNSYQEGKRDQLLPNMAYDWWTDAAGTSWTLLLKKGVKFSNGEEMTCADVKFSLETIRDTRDAKGSQLRRSPRAAYIGRVKTIECPDNHTVRIGTDGPLNSLPASLTSLNFIILPKSVYEGHLEKTQTDIGPGTGAFLLDSVDPTEHLTFKRNPNYWNQPYPYLDSVKYQFLGSLTALQSAYRVGRVDDTSDSSIPPSISSEMAKEGKVVIEPMIALDGMTTWETNYLRPPWGDKRLMNAIRCAIDSRKAIDTGARGVGFEAPVFPLETDPNGTDWAMTKEQWKAIGPCHGPSAETDMAKRMQMAQDLMKQLGFGPDNIARPVVPLQQMFSIQAWPSVQQDLAKIWIEPNATVVTYAQAVEKASAGEFDMYSHGYVTNRKDPDQWFYEQVYSTSNRNYGKYTNPEMDALIDRMSREVDGAKRHEMVDELSTMWLKDDVKIFVYYSGGIPLRVPWVFDHYYTLPGNQQNRYKFIRTWVDPQIKARVLGQ
jgi:ABC-type transport system substrate-binding protein